MQRILGTKLRNAREELGLTQGALAKAVSLSGEFISHLELGKRTPSLETLTALANYLKKDIPYFLKEKEETFDILTRGERIDKKAKKELKKFQKYCEEYIHLEEQTGRRLELAPLYTHISADRMAGEERRRLGLGNEPIRDVFSLFELNGCRIIRQPFPEESKISGVFIFLEAHKAAFTLINSAQSYGRQVFTAVHEYCHYLKDRNSRLIVDNPDIFIDEYLSLYHPREKFARTFAIRFLIPPAKIEEIIEKDIRSKKMSLENVLYLKRYFGVSTADILRTLKELGYLSRTKYEEYQKKVPDLHEETVFGIFEQSILLKKGKKGPIISDRFKSLAIEAYQKKKISPEKLSELINQDKNRLISALGKPK